MSLDESYQKLVLCITGKKDGPCRKRNNVGMEAAEIRELDQGICSKKHKKNQPASKQVLLFNIAHCKDEKAKCHA